MSASVRQFRWRNRIYGPLLRLPIVVRAYLYQHGRHIARRASAPRQIPTL